MTTSLAAVRPDPVADRFQSVVEIGRVLGSTLELDALLAIVMNRITELLDAERSTLFLVDRATGDLWSKVAQGAGLERIRLAQGQGLAGHVARTGEIVNVTDAYTDPRFNPEVDRLTGFHTAALLAVPIRGKDGSVIGVAQALNRRGDRAFDPDDERALSAMANLVGIALENAQLVAEMRAKTEELERTQERLRRKVAEVDLLFEIEREISQATAFDPLVESILERAMSTVHAARAAVLVREDGADLVQLKARGSPLVALPPASLSEDALAHRVLLTSRPALTSRPDELGRSLASRSGEVAGALVAVPLVVHERGGDTRVTGVLELDRAGQPFTDDDAKLAAMVAGQLARAVSLWRSRAETERAGRLAALGQMLGGIVHDLRSPMTVIGGYAELMVREETESERERYAELVLNQLDQVNAMTHEVLAFVRGERQVLVRRVSLASFWSDLKRTLSRELEPRRVALHITLDYDGHARLDESKIRRMVMNLARNAAQAMSHGGRFSIRCEADGDTLVLQFADDGPGLPAQVAARLFSAFNSHGKVGGTGLGLAIVKEAVESHGGTVSCTTAPGQGTSFSIRLPGAVAR